MLVKCWIVFGALLFLGTSCAGEPAPQDVQSKTNKGGHVSQAKQGTHNLTSESTSALDVRARDLAVVFPDTGSEMKIQLRSMMSRAWYRQVVRSFDQGFFSNPIEEDGNVFSDWRLVSARLVPCGPLGNVVRGEPDAICWPEIRLIFQPILERFRTKWGVEIPAFAEDRAIHMLFDVKGAGVPSTEVDALLTQVKSALAKNRGRLQDVSLQRRLRAAHQKIIPSFLKSIMELRRGTLRSIRYDGVKVRPEADDRTTAVAFRRAFLSLVERFRVSLPKEITAFSLPSGRTPALSNEWMFVAFAPKTSTLLEQKDLLIRSPKTGDVLVNLGKHEISGVGGLEQQALAVLKTLTPAQRKELEEVAVLSGDGALDVKRRRIADRAQLLVPNTSCASCHRLNQKTPFNFRNLSYLTNIGLEVSPRVIRDVELDLKWVKSFLKKSRSAQ
ncbi:MAG: hypothetical protein AAGJ35_01735 [Myxococcota bacterium]